MFKNNYKSACQMIFSSGAWIQIEKTLLIAGAVFLVLVFHFLYLNHLICGNKMEKIKIGNEAVFEVEIINSQKKLEEGLSGRKIICANCGMLFEFGNIGQHSFWMKGMKFDLDILWILKGEIVYIAKNTSYSSKETITPRVESDKVLEINAGMADKLGVKIGDRLE